MCGVSFENAWPKTSGLAAFSSAVSLRLDAARWAGTGSRAAGRATGEKSSGFVSTL